jgi:N-acetyl-anhydromuramyl-L-alanine amidase AmpD
MLSELDEKNLAWKQIWLLTQKNAAGEFEYRKGLTLVERQEIIDVLRDFLDYTRSIEVATTGKVLGPADSTSTEAKDDGETQDQPSTLQIHDPKSYSFDEKHLWIPWAKSLQSGAKRGSYPKKYPAGLVLHWTAGHRNGLEAGNEVMRNTGMLYLLGDKDGNIGQSDSLAYHGYHAGVSSHKFANGYVSDEWVGLELQAAGTLSKVGDQYIPWFKKPVPAEEVVYSAKRENISAGYYHRYTYEQMLATRKLVCWLHLNNPSVFSIDRVCGHDEVSPGRKTDPGASVFAYTAPNSTAGKVMTMSEFRTLCKSDVAKILASRK